MFSSGPNYTKLKTNLRLAVVRLKLLEKKKMELAQKARKEIADYISSGKIERAKIRVEYIIREDYMVEAMEMIEMFCDLLLARFGLIEQMKVLDAGIAEAVSSLLWVAPRLVSDIQEMKPISDQLSMKYGKIFADACRDDTVATISDKLKLKMGVAAPPKTLVEKYLIEISKNFNVPYEPDPQVMSGDKSIEALLLDLDDRNNLGGEGSGGGSSGGGGGGGGIAPPGFKDFPPAPIPATEFQPPYPSLPSASNNVNIGGFVVPQSSSSSTKPSNSKMGYGAPFSYNIPPSGTEENVFKPTNFSRNFEEPPPSYSNFALPEDKNQQKSDKPKLTPRAKISPTDSIKPKNTDLFPELPNVPNDIPNLTEDDLNNRNDNKDEEIDFDDLTRRFEMLKKKK